MLALFCIQTANLEMDAKTLYYSLLKKRNYTDRIFYQRNLQIDRSFFASYGNMPWIILFWVFGDFYASGMQDPEITKSLVVHVLGGYNWLKNSPYFCLFKYVWTVKQKDWSKAQKCGGAHFTCVRLFCYAKWFWAKKIWLFLQFFGGTLL